MFDCRYNAPDRKPHGGDMQANRKQLELETQNRERLLDQLIDCLYSIDSDTDTSAIDRCLEELETVGVLCEDQFDVEQGLKYFHKQFSTVFEK